MYHYLNYTVSLICKRLPVRKNVKYLKKHESGFGVFIPYVNLLTYLHVCTYLLLAVIILPDIPLSKCVYLRERYIKLCKTQCWINIRTTYITLVKCYYISGSLAIAGYRLFCSGSVFCGSSSCHRDVHYVPSYTVQSYTVKKHLS